MKRILQGGMCFIVGFILSYASLHFIAYQIVDHFSVRKIGAKLPFKQADNLPTCIHQPFTYLGKGSQSYVFESLDGEYVLKFFRMNRYKTFPLPSKLETINLKKEKKLKNLFTSCKIAHKHLKSETGLIYLHLEQSTNLQSEVLIYDALKRPHIINLDKVPFLIQRKAKPLYSHLKELIDNGDTNEVCHALRSLKKLLADRFEKGVADHDPVIEKNSGYLDGKALFIDIGQFYLNPEIRQREAYHIEGQKVVRKLKIWLQQQDPEHYNLYLNALKF